MNRYFNGVFIALIALLLIRILSLGLYPLMDTTEARYGEIARIMAETDDWITPYFDYNVPFWGKPPLSFWLSALSFKVFGVNEFAARFPSWLCSLGTLLVLVHAEAVLGIRERFLASLLLLSTLVFYFVAGGVMTEASLVLGLVLSLVSLLQLITKPQNNYRWSVCLGLGLAIGMLAKGPIALVMVGTPLVFWMLVHRQWHLIRQVRGWLPAMAVFLLLSLPWYILAEQKTPGFIDYFILGEHFNRFVQPGWPGDLYGTAHREAYGTIWWFWLLAAFPSSWWVISLLGRKLFNSRWGERSYLRLDHFDYLLLYFAFFPQVFFCFAGNILMSYVVPGVSALALFIARHAHLLFKSTVLRGRSLSDINNLQFPRLSLVTPVLLCLIIFYAVNIAPQGPKSERDLMALTTGDHLPIYYLHKIEFSARFYSAARARLLALDAVSSLEGEIFYIAVPHHLKNQHSLKSLSLEWLGDNRRYGLYRSR